MLERLRKQVKELETDIEGLEEKIRAKKSKKETIAAQVQARIFLESIFAPYIDGLCAGLGMSPEDGLRLLIENERTLDEIAFDNRDALMELLGQPECKVILAAARPLGNVSEEWIKDKTEILLEVMGKTRPSMAKILIATPGGKDWFYKSLIGLRDILFGKPRTSFQNEAII